MSWIFTNGTLLGVCEIFLRTWAHLHFLLIYMLWCYYHDCSPCYVESSLLCFIILYVVFHLFCECPGLHMLLWGWNETDHRWCSGCSILTSHSSPGLTGPWCPQIHSEEGPGRPWCAQAHCQVVGGSICPLWPCAFPTARLPDVVGGTLGQKFHLHPTVRSSTTQSGSDQLSFALDHVTLPKFTHLQKKWSD